MKSYVYTNGPYKLNVMYVVYIYIYECTIFHAGDVSSNTTHYVG